MNGADYKNLFMNGRAIMDFVLYIKGVNFVSVGIKKHIDKNIQVYYDSHFDILSTPDFDDKTRLLKSNHGIKKIGSSTNKICRFCGKNEKEVSFRKIAHVFPESIGNNALASNYECDVCNQYFGNTIENEYAKYFSLYHSIMQVSGKNGVPKSNFKIPCSKNDGSCAKDCVKIYYENNMPCICTCKEVDTKYIKFQENELTISKPVGKCCPIAVFKAIVKMAITVMPVEEISLFDNAVKWLIEPKHVNFYKNKPLLVRFQMIPGFNVTKYPHYVLFRRKRTVWNKPYVLFNLTYGCLSLFIEVPRDVDDCSTSEFLNMPFPPIPFYTSVEGVWDFSGTNLAPNTINSITLNFEKAIDCTEEVKFKKYK